MKILVTRPEPDASRLAERLRASGLEPVVEPLMQVANVSVELSLSGIQALAFTSANGVRAFAARDVERALPVFAVGEATALAARGEGFTAVHTAGGDVDHLAGLIGAILDPDDGPLLHIAGKVVAGDLAATLAVLGFQVERVVLYGTEPSKELSPSLRAMLQDGTLDGVTLYSPRTARIFVELMREAGLPALLAPVTCYALSENVAKAAAQLPWARIDVASSPNEDALLELLEED